MIQTDAAYASTIGPRQLVRVQHDFLELLLRIVVQMDAVKGAWSLLVLLGSNSLPDFVVGVADTPLRHTVSLEFHVELESMA